MCVCVGGGGKGWFDKYVSICKVGAWNIFTLRVCIRGKVIGLSVVS